MPDLSLSRLDEGQLALAYPLIRAAARVSLERWKTFARQLIASGGGILAVGADDGCLHGVASFREVGSLRFERSLQVDILVAFELSRMAPVRRALCAGLEGIAREMGCRSIIFTTAARNAEPASAGRLSWEELGLKMETVSFVRHVQPEAAAP
ncbi:hypothetical protein [Sphingosinicella sp. YJ22]|uniref:hypothetical protein n=1 Tax=Sphingosinicella sp. YJ22 TaxID=1104780 RepID=UPI00140E9475|nr:hypothetical protein [Sphingosinicella sp. YJ22]